MYSNADLASLRVRKDISEISTSRFTCTNARTFIEFPDGMHNILRIKVTIEILSGPYTGGILPFMLEIPYTYPFHAPTVTCLKRIWHPCVDLNTGVVLMPMLGKDWRPVLSINTVILGLQLGFLEPNPESSVNQKAAETLKNDPNEFKKQVQATLQGGSYFGFTFESHQANSSIMSSSKRTRDTEIDVESVHKRNESFNQKSKRVKNESTTAD